MISMDLRGKGYHKTLVDAKLFGNVVNKFDCFFFLCIASQIFTLAPVSLLCVFGRTQVQNYNNYLTSVLLKGSGRGLVVRVLNSGL